MKNILSFMFLLFGALAFVACEDKDDNGGTNTNREFMTMFITDNTRGKGTDYPYNCGLDAQYPHGNTIHLYWYGVKDCAGFQIQMALQPKVSGGSEAWASVQGTKDLLVDTIVGPNQLDLVLENLQYSTDYRFAIRALSKKDANIKGNLSSFAHASNWYGHGNGRQWQEYLGIATKDRYPTPYVVYADQSKTTETTMHLMLATNVSELLDEDQAEPKDGLILTDPADKEIYDSYFENFNIDAAGNFGYQVLTVEPSPNNPNSTVGEKWRYHIITPEERAQGYIDIDGLQKNSVYVINVRDTTVHVDVDSKYNTYSGRTDGTPGDPILLKHDEMIATYGNAPLTNMGTETLRSEVFANANNYNAAPISPVLYDFISNSEYAEGQTFLLEGGKTYYIDGNDITCKGFVLRTDPADIAAGKGRAKVLSAIGVSSAIFSSCTNGEQWQGSSTMFMFGRQPEAGEGGEIYMKKLAFYDIDFDNPLANNQGDTKAGVTVTGNYFFNMYSNGMAVTLDSLVIKDCSFKRVVRGFIREQGVNYKKWKHVLIEGNDFFDCGYYSNAAGGYPWIAGSGTNVNTNLWEDFKLVNNTIYDCPFPSFFCDAGSTEWAAGIKWNIVMENNTFVNFNTRASGAIFNMRNVPDGSEFTVKNNLFSLAKQEGDQRVLGFWGADIRETYKAGVGIGAGKITLNFSNNWSTNDHLTNGSIFSANGWESKNNNFGKLVDEKLAELNGELTVNVGDVSSTELFISPCPPHKASSSDERHMHRTDAIDGTATTGYNVNLYYKSTSNQIVAAGAGATKWAKGAPAGVRRRR